MGKEPWGVAIMAEFLIYNTDSWMDALTEREVAERTADKPTFEKKYLARYQRGDIIEVRPDGYWTGPKAKGFDKSVFRVIAVPGVKADRAYMEGTEDKNRRFSITVNDGDTTTRPTIDEIGLVDKAAAIDGDSR